MPKNETSPHEALSHEEKRLLAAIAATSKSPSEGEPPATSSHKILRYYGFRPSEEMLESLNHKDLIHKLLIPCKDGSIEKSGAIELSDKGKAALYEALKDTPLINGRDDGYTALAVASNDNDWKHIKSSIQQGNAMPDWLQPDIQDTGAQRDRMLKEVLCNLLAFKEAGRNQFAAPQPLLEAETLDKIVPGITPEQMRQINSHIERLVEDKMRRAGILLRNEIVSLAQRSMIEILQDHGLLKPLDAKPSSHVGEVSDSPPIMKIYGADVNFTPPQDGRLPG